MIDPRWPGLTLLALLLATAPTPGLAQTEGGFVPPEESPPPLVSAPADEGIEGVEEDAHAGDTQHLVSITWSPLHLVQPVVEFTGAYRLADQLDAAAILGVGRVKVGTAGLDAFMVFEAGGQFRYYPVGYFEHGMQLGVEVLAIVLTGSSGTTSGTGAGLSFGPFLGYKIAANIGFTFEIQLGAVYNLVMATATSNGTTATMSDGDFGVLLNIGLGWSF